MYYKNFLGVCQVITMPFQKGHKLNLGNKYSLGNPPSSTSFKKGNIPWNKGISYSNPKMKIIQQSKEYRLKEALAHKGKKSHFWKGGITKKNELLRKGLKFRLWREAVFKRDNWICHWCGIRGGKLHPHHIESFAKYLKLRFVLSNGLTLCEECHKLTDSYKK